MKLIAVTNNKIYIKIPHGEIQIGIRLGSVGFWFKGKHHWIYTSKKFKDFINGNSR